MMEGIKKGILKGFLELDEKLRKIPEVASGWVCLLCLTRKKSSIA